MVTLLLVLFFMLFERGVVAAVEDTTNYNLRVLFVKLSPVEGGEDMIKHFFGWQFPGKTTDQGLNLGINANINAFKRLSNNRINYEVVKKLDIATFPKYTNGYVYDFAKYTKCTNGTDTAGECERQKYYFDHIDWAKSNNICQLARDNNIDEIWMASPPFIATWENFMIGPKEGFNVNGGVYVLPECDKNYVVMSSGWTTDSFAHIYGHRVESTMNYMTQNWKSEDKISYWEKFAAVSLYSQPYGGGTTVPPREAYCGNSHFPHNATGHYDTANKTYADSICGDWKNIPNFTGQKVSINCERWGCSDSGIGGWGEYWMGSIPREQGGISLISKKGINFVMKNNWWYYLLYPENAIIFVKETTGLLVPTPTLIPTVTPVKTPTTVPPTPTKTPTKTPIPTPTDILISPTSTMVPLTPTVTLAPCPKKSAGDANCDGKVNINDFGIWKMEFIKKGDQKMADFNNDGRVNINDFGIWKIGFLEK